VDILPYQRLGHPSAGASAAAFSDLLTAAPTAVTVHPPHQLHILEVPLRHPTLAAALAAAVALPGMVRIVLSPGTYKEAVTITRPNVEICGLAPRPTIESSAVTVTVRAGGVRLVNLAIHQLGKSAERAHGVQIVEAANVVLENCDLLSANGSAATATGDRAAVTLVRCAVRGAKMAGIYATNGARVTADNCHITGAEYAAIHVKRRAELRARECVLRDNKQSGIIFQDGGGSVTHCTIDSCGGCAIVFKAGAAPIVHMNTLSDSALAGMFCCEFSRPTITDNTIRGSGRTGVLIKTNADPLVRGNRITGGGETGVYVMEGGRGRLEENEIVGNASAGVLVTTAGRVSARGNRIARNGYEGVWVCKGGAGSFEGNTLEGNVRGATDIQPDCQVEWAQSNTVIG
jgi:parallel beta-helix repeat protein